MKHLLLGVLLVLGCPAWADPFFGYVAVACGHDDPFDDSARTDYSAEVAGWTNANHLCLTGDPATWADRIAAAARLWRPILSVEPAFDFLGAGPGGPVATAVWPIVRQAVRDSGVAPSDVIFYLVDEPTLRGIGLDRVETAARIIRADFPQSGVMMIEAYHGADLPMPPPSVTLWGFDAYTVPDPLAEPLYTDYLARSRASLGPGQRIVLVLDGNHTPVHANAGLSETDMADVALAYGRLAASIPDLGGMIGYTWAGGIDTLDEKGVRDLPPAVQAAHRVVAAQVLGR